MISKPVDCLIIGAGIAGAAAARALARAGRRVLLLDPGTPGAEATAAAAGMLAPQVEAGDDDPLRPLALAARDAYPALAAELAATGRNVGLNLGGIALVALDDARAGELEADAARQREMGLDAQWLDRAGLAKRQPGIGPDARGALLAPRDGCVDNVRLCAALIADALHAGALIAPEQALELIVASGRVTGVRTASGVRAAPLVVLAAGAWSGRLRGLPRPVPITPVRGQMLAVAWPAGEPRNVVFGRGAYVVPRGDEALLGSTMEDVGYDKSTTTVGLTLIRFAAEALLPALRDLPELRAWAGLRPMTPDGLPILGWDPDVEGLMYATGHSRNGILLGPITGRIVRDLALHGETAWDLAPYSIQRF